jgi:16S rRNA (cytosine1407-C5)-methyltransferase
MGKKSKSPEDKIEQKKKQWIERTAEVLHVSEETVGHLLSVPRQQSIRLNPLKADPNKTIGELKTLGWQGQPVGWCTNGYTVESDLKKIRDSDLVSNGAAYIQNAASWLPVLALNAQPDDDILDVCAAPGGKTSHIAALTSNKARITANDNSKPRLAKIRANLARMGVDNVFYTMYDAMYLSHKIYGRRYDKILLDAPCSGEGMMALGNDKDFATWSVAHIKRLQQLQRRILSQSWQLLKPGGTLVYSTCTMAPEENEAVIDYLLRHNDDVMIEQIKMDLPNRVSPVMSWNGKDFDHTLKFAMRLIPSPEVEAFFVCKLTKTLDNQYPKM